MGHHIKTKEQAELWLKANHPEFEILHWCGPQSKETLLKDKQRNVEFKYAFMRFKAKVIDNPNRFFGASTEQRIKAGQEAMQKKHGKSFALQIKKFKQKQEQTIQDRFGFDNVMKSKEFLKQKGIVELHEGKSAEEWAEDLGVSRSHFYNVLNHEGLDVAKQLKQNKTNIEIEIEKILKGFNENFIFNTWNKDFECVPDFLLEDKKIVIEANGLHWHTEQFVEKQYHFKRMKKFKEKEFKCLFFNGDEIINKTHIVKSIIQNKLGLSKKIGARKTIIQKISKKEAKNFFEQNHLMGNGKGQTYALANSCNEILVCIQINLKNKQQNLYEISRFCTKNGISVVGGYSKLLKYILELLKPFKLINFIDQRYGDGNYLLKMGFFKENENLSFRWAKGIVSHHRTKFKSNTGYDHGFIKIWDCGQAKYVLTLNDN